jgi:hypothetical protein
MPAKKSSIGSVFIYAVSALIVILVVYFGWRGITAIYKANEESAVERMQMRMRADMSQLSMHYGTTAKFSYDLGGRFSRICFVGLYLNSTDSEQRDLALLDYPLILDSINSSMSSNVFALGEDFLAFDIGKIKIECAPFVFCINSTMGRISFLAEGGGDSVIIKNCE